MIGDEHRIYVDELNRILTQMLSAVPAEIRQEFSEETFDNIRRRIMVRPIERKLLVAYLSDQPLTDEQFEAFKKDREQQAQAQGMTLAEIMSMQGMTMDDLRVQATQVALQERTAGPAKAAAYVKESPVSYFDGTTTEASHILLMVKPYDPPAEHKEARRKLAELARRIKSGELTFEEAAREVSECPSSAQGGKLGSFLFHQMVPGFAEKAFDMEVGQVSGVVPSRFGYHLLRVTGRTKGSGEAAEDAVGIAANVLLSKLNTRILRQAARKYPVKILIGPDAEEDQADQ
jgi:peptidyl-prolyl cis-trans isomerase C